LKDSAFRFIDDIRTPQVESLGDQVTSAFAKASKGLEEEQKKNGLIWWKHRNPSILHLAKILMPFAHSGLQVGGWSNTINAVSETHGPSWRMIIQLSSPTEAYGVYPGGQSGNPGSPYYDNFTDYWTTGKYYTLWLMKQEEASDKRIQATLTFTHS
jgi:penicillin amidase